MASQQQPRPLFRFASMVRPAAQPTASAPPAPAPQPMFRPPVATPFRPQAPEATTTAPPPIAVMAPPQPQPVAAASPRSTPVTPPPRSPLAPPQSVVSPSKVPSPRSPVAAQPQLAATDVPKSPVTIVTTSVPQSPFKTFASNVTAERAPTSTPYSSLPPSPKTKTADSIQTLINQLSPSKAPTPSQKVNQPKAIVSHPPSPLRLPPPQLELESKIPPQVDQKSVVVQETTRANTNGHHVMQTTRNEKTVENGRRESVKKDKGVHEKKVSNSHIADDFGMSVLTLAGENKGAIMELSPSRKTYSPQIFQKKGSPKAWRSEDDGEKSEKMPNKPLPMNAFMNSNVQGINNSILHNASCTHHDPGVHLVFSRKTNGSHGFHIKGSPKS